MKNKLVLAAFLASFSTVSLAERPTPNLEAWRVLVNSGEFAEKTSGEAITSIKLKSHEGVSTVQHFGFSISTSAPGMSFPTGEATSHPCILSANVTMIGGVVTTDWTVQIEKICAMN